MPPVNRLRVETRLTNVSLAVKSDGFVADAVFPILLVPKQAGEIMEDDLSMLSADASGDDRIAQGEEPPIIKGDFGTQTYSTTERARGAMVHDDEVDADSAEDAPYEVKVQATELASLRLLRNREQRTATLALAGATGATPATKWDNDGDVVEDVQTQRIAAYDASGVILNHMVIPWHVVEKIKTNTAVKDYFKGGATTENPAMLDLAVLRRLFGIPNIHVAGAQSVSGTLVAGEKSGTLSSIWGNDVLLYYRPETPRRREPAFGYTFVWSGAFRGAARNARGQVVTETYEARKRALIIDARTYSQEKVIMATAARKLTSVLT
jgi:hypothetical protein